MQTIRTILLPTDFSDASRCALDVACGLAADYQAGLVIIHVIAAPPLFSDAVVRPRAEHRALAIRTKLDHLGVPDDGINVVRRIEAGNPATEILNMAHVCQADLIVMGSHGRRGLQRWLMGSVAEEVMRQATCPVLTITTQMAGRANVDARHAMQGKHV